MNLRLTRIIIGFLLISLFGVVMSIHDTTNSYIFPYIAVNAVAPTNVTITPVGGTLVANSLNSTNTHMTATATIIQGQATDGYAELLVGGVVKLTDSSILAGDTTVTFTTSDGSPTNEELQAAIASGGVVSVRVFDSLGNNETSADSNPTLNVDYSAPIMAERFYREITIDHTKIGGADLVDFPVLISLTGLSNINANGTDIRFMASDRVTELSREIVSYDVGTGTLEAWVKVPAVSSAVDTKIYMYYGNSSAVEPGASTVYGRGRVWSDTYKNVFHMNDLTTSTIKDSTLNGNNGTKIAANESLEVAGKIGRAQDFDGVNDGINTTFNGFPNSTVETTVEFWNNVDVFIGSVGSIFGGGPLTNRFLAHVPYMNGNVIFDLGNINTTGRLETAWGGVTGQWYHWTLTSKNGAGMKIYRNGVEIASNATNDVFLKGAMGFSLGWLFDGKIDEFRLMDSVKPAGWALAEYNNQSDPSTFYAVGAETPTGVGNITITPVGGTVVANSLNSTNTHMTATATIIPGQATDGYAQLLIDGVVKLTDSSILADDTTVTFTTSDGSPTNAELQAAIASGGVVSVKVFDSLGNNETSAISNPTLNVDYSAPIMAERFYREITIDHTKIGGSDLVDFPVLISLTGLSNINANGTDIRFMVSDRVTELAREIVNYNVGTGTLEAWVKVPAISSAVDTKIYMYYGNSSALEPGASTVYGSGRVWVDTYKNVYHMNDLTTSTIKDSTLNGNNGTKAAANESLEVAGKIGRAQDFDGANDLINTTFNGFPNSTVETTVEFWSNVDLITLHSLFMASPDQGDNRLIGHVPWQTDENVYFDVGNPSTGGRLNTAWGGVIGQWYHWTFTSKNGTGMKIYRNGVEIASTASNDVFTKGIKTLKLGYTYDGKIDEFRIMDSVKSAGWALAQYNNQSDPSTFYAVGAETPTGVGNITITPVGGTVVANTLNSTNTHMTATATIIAGQATDGYAQLLVDGVVKLTDSTILAGDTTVTFTTSDGSPTNEELQNTIGSGGVVSVRVFDAAGNYQTSSDGNPTLNVDYSAPIIAERFYREITIDHTKIGGADLVDFPVLISITGLSNINSNGTDIRFMASNRITELARDIVSYDVGTGTLEAWVKVPAVSSTVDTKIYMYYGNTSALEPGASTVYGRGRVWADTYKNVYHMNDLTTSTIKDSTLNGNNGTKAAANESLEVAGKIGRAQDFDGANDIINTTFNGFPDSTVETTVEFWSNVDVIKDSVIFSSGPPENRFLSCLPWGDGSACFDLGNITNAGVRLSTPWGGVTGQWYHWTLTSKNGTGMKMYRNGVEIASKATNDVFLKGVLLLTLGWSFNGKIDEFRIMDSVKPAGWVLAQYNNQSDPSTFYAVGAETPTGVGNITITPVGGTVVANSLNSTNTHMTATATIMAGQATNGYAQFLIDGVVKLTDSSILAGDTTVTFTTSDGSPTNEELQVAIGSGGVVSVRVFDAAGNYQTSSDGNPTLNVDYSAPIIAERYYREITIDHTKIGGADLVDFPVLISITGLSNINANGTDIRFMASDRITELAREIVNYNVGTGTLEAWVKVPAVSSTVDTKIYMYYGNSSALEPGASTVYGRGRVWADTYKNVYHMNDLTTSTIKDSTLNGNNGTKAAANESLEVAGKIGRAQDFDGVNDQILTTFNGFPNSTVETTVEFWNNVDLIQANSLFKAIPEDVTNRFCGLVPWTNGNTIFWLGRSAPTDGQIFTPWGGVTGQWYHWTLTSKNGTGMKIYRNGTEIANKATTDVFTKGIQTLLIGRFYDGKIDEFRIMDSVKPAGWALAQYNNQSNPFTFYAVGAETPTGLANITITPVGVTVVSNTLNSTNTHMTATATIIAGQATNGYAQFLIDGVVKLTDSTILAGDTTVTFTTSDGSPTNEDLRAAIASGGVVSVRLFDVYGNSSTSVDNPTLAVDYIAPTVALSDSQPDLIVKDADTEVITATFNEGMTSAPTISIDVSTAGDADISPVAMTMGGNNTTWTYSWDVPAGHSGDTARVTVAGSDIAGNAYAGATNIEYTIDNIAPTNQDTVFTTSIIKYTGSNVTIVSSGDANNSVWFAPPETTNFIAGVTMTRVAGDQTTIVAPARAGIFKLYVVDQAGNISAESTATLTVEIYAQSSVLPPTVVPTPIPAQPQIYDIVDGEYYNRDVAVRFDGGTAQLNGQNINSGYVASSEGVYTLTVTNEVGNAVTRGFTIDKTPPVITGVTNNMAYLSSRIINFNEGLATLNEKECKSGQAVSQEGEYVLKVIDFAGNKTTLSFSILNQNANIIGVVNGGIYKGQVNIEVKTGEPYLDGNLVSKTFTVKEEGTHKLVVKHSDNSMQTVTFTIDSRPPTVSGVEDGKSYNYDVAINFDNATATVNGKPYISETPIKDEGTYSLIVESLAGVVKSLEFKIDKTPPKISGIEDGATYYEPVAINFNEGKGTLDGISIENGSIVAVEGEHELIVKDGAGNKTSLKFKMQGMTIDGILKAIKQNPENKGNYTTYVNLMKKEGKLYSIGMFVNGELVDFSQYDNATPVIIKDRVLVPVRIVAEKLGFNMAWDGIKKEIIAELEDLKVVFTLNSNLLTVNGTTMEMDVPATTINGRTLIPIRFVSTIFKRSIHWENGGNGAGVVAIYSTGSSEEVAADELSADEIEKLKELLVPTISGVRYDGFYNKDVEVRISFQNVYLDGSQKATEASSGILDVKLNGKDFIGGNISKEGRYELVAKVVGGGEKNIVFTIDKTPPKVFGVEHGATYTEPVTINFDESIGILNDNYISSGTKVDKTGLYLLFVVDKANNVTKVIFKMKKAEQELLEVLNSDHKKYDELSINKYSDTISKVIINGKEVTGDIKLNEEGVYNIKIIYRDGTEKTSVIEIDKTPPSLILNFL